VSIFSLDIQD